MKGDHARQRGRRTGTGPSANGDSYTSRTDPTQTEGIPPIDLDTRTCSMQQTGTDQGERTLDNHARDNGNTGGSQTGTRANTRTGACTGSREDTGIHSNTSHANTPEENTHLKTRQTDNTPTTQGTDRDATLGEENTHAKQHRKRNRKRKITWYNPPFNKAVTTNLGKAFLALIDKHFPNTRKDKLNKIINRHTVKLSYSCTPNMKSLINTHNTKLLNKTVEQTQALANSKKTCNCRIKQECPLQGNCLARTVVYKATITTQTTTKTYVGSTEATFKKRYYAHKADMNKQANRNNTTLANFVWDAKDRGEEPTVTWQILRNSKSYRCGTRKCDLCLTEKLMILKEKGPSSLNRRSELMGTCRHRRKFRLANVKDV